MRTWEPVLLLHQKGQYECNWISMQVTLNKDGDINATLNTNYVKTMARILVCGTGLNASYDYSNLFGRLNWGGEAEAEFRKYSVGNGVCNYRHVFAIYYEDVNKTQRVCFLIRMVINN